MNEVQYYSALEKELKHSQKEKAYKFMELGLIEYDKEKKAFVCKPIPGYNSTTYQLIPLKEKLMLGDSKIDFECNCHGYQTRKKRGETPLFCPTTFFTSDELCPKIPDFVPGFCPTT
jgi:hypothetical protein